jgi:hypothetical protein
VAPAPAAGLVPGTAARRRHRPGRGPAGRTVRPRRAPGPRSRLLPAGGRGRGRRLRPRGGDPAALRGPGHRPEAGARPGAGPARARRPRDDGCTAQRPVRLRRAPPGGGPGAVPRTRRIAGTAGPRARRPGGPVGVAVRPGSGRRRPPDRRTRSGVGRARFPAVRRRPLRLRRLRSQPGQAGRGAAPLRDRRPGGVRGVVEHRHPARRPRPRLGRARSLAAGQRRSGGIREPGRGHARPLDRPSVQPRGGPGICVHHPPAAIRAGPPAARRDRAGGDLRALRLRLLPRVGLDPARVAPRRGRRRDTGTARHREPDVAAGLRPDAVLAGAAGGPPRPLRAARGGAVGPRRRRLGRPCPFGRLVAAGGSADARGLRRSARGSGRPAACPRRPMPSSPG